MGAQNAKGHAETGIAAVMAAHGVALAGSGPELKGLCPFHDDQTPSLSVNPEKGVWHCFGCGAGGNAAKFVARKRGIGMAEARAWLRAQGASRTGMAESVAARGIRLPMNRAEVLANVAAHYHRTFRQASEGRAYLASRGLHDEALFLRFRLGFADGSLLKHAKKESDVGVALREIGLVTPSGAEHFRSCVVVPLYDEHECEPHGQGRCVGMYGRRIVGGASRTSDTGPSHLYLPGPHKGVVNAAAFTAGRAAPGMGSRTIILTEAILDALAIYQAGFPNVVPLYGTNGLTDLHLRLLKLHRLARVIIAFDADEAGNRGAEKLAALLAPLEIPTSRVMFPAGTDACEFLSKEGKPAFEKLVAEAAPVSVAITAKSGATCHVSMEGEDFDFSFGTENARRYIVRLIESEGYRLKANLRAIAHDGRFHVDTIDLYMSRSRSAFVKAAARLFGCEPHGRECEPDIIEGDAATIIERLEAFRKEKRAGETRPDGYQMTADEEAEALAFLKRPDLLDAIAGDLGILGYVGEAVAKKIGYLVSVSRKLASPLSAVLVSTAGAGKSKLMEHLAELAPPEEVVWYTRITPQALYYKPDRSLAHKLIVACEEEGLSGASYSLRELISSKKLRMAAPVKDPVTGRQKTVDYEVEGPVAILFSTEEEKETGTAGPNGNGGGAGRAGGLDHATATRLFVLRLDESREQTRAIMEAQRYGRTLEGVCDRERRNDVIRLHRNAQRLLRPVLVVNPLARTLTFPDHRVTARREHEKYLSLIEAIAFLRQHQRPMQVIEHRGERREYVEVTAADIAEADDLLGAILPHAFDELKPGDRELLGMIREMTMTLAERAGIDLCEVKFNRRDIREQTGMSDHQVRSRLGRLVALEYVLPVAGRRGAMFRYELAYECGPHGRTPEAAAPAAVGAGKPEDVGKHQSGSDYALVSPTSRPVRGGFAVEVVEAEDTAAEPLRANSGRTSRVRGEKELTGFVE